MYFLCLLMRFEQTLKMIMGCGIMNEKSNSNKERFHLIGCQTLFLQVQSQRGSDEFIVSFFFFTLNQPEDKDIMKKPVLLLLFKKTIFILIYIILIQKINMLWDGRIRTSEWRDQNPLPYRLATPHFYFDSKLIKLILVLVLCQFPSPKISMNWISLLFVF